MEQMIEKYNCSYEQGRLALIERTIPFGSGTALDIGCGIGALSSKLIDHGYSVIGIDSNEEVIKEARSRVPQAQFVAGNVLSDIPTGSYDLIVAAEIIEHFCYRDQVQLLQNLATLLRPEGHLIMSTPNAASVMSLIGHIIYPLQGRRWDYGDATHIDVHNAWSLRRLLQHCGYSIVGQSGFQILTHRPDFITKISLQPFSNILSWFCYNIVVDAIVHRS